MFLGENLSTTHTYVTLTYGATATHVLLNAYQGLPVVTNMDENSTRRDFTSVRKGRPPGVFQETCRLQLH